jgi:hypothetical protein
MVTASRFVVKAHQSLGEFGEQLRLDAGCQRRRIAECGFHRRSVATFEGNTTTEGGLHLRCDGGVRDGVEESLRKIDVLHLQRRFGGVKAASVRIGGICRTRNCCIEILPRAREVVESDSRLGAHDEEHRILLGLFYGQRLQRVLCFTRIELRLGQPCECVWIAIVQMTSPLKILLAVRLIASLTPQVGPQHQKPDGEG